MRTHLKKITSLKEKTQNIYLLITVGFMEAVPRNNTPSLSSKVA